MTPQEELIEIARRYYAWKATLSPTTLAMMEAVPDKLIREIVHDNRRSYTAPSSMAATPDVVKEEEPWKHKAADIPLKPPPGVDRCDQMMNQQDAIDRAELIGRLRK
jgi:hypothetical protein